MAKGLSFRGAFSFSPRLTTTETGRLLTDNYIIIQSSESLRTAGSEKNIKQTINPETIFISEESK
jgi:hypothetical protein